MTFERPAPRRSIARHHLLLAVALPAVLLACGGSGSTTSADDASTTARGGDPGDAGAGATAEAGADGHAGDTWSGWRHYPLGGQIKTDARVLAKGGHALVLSDGSVFDFDGAAFTTATLPSVTFGYATLFLSPAGSVCAMGEMAVECRDGSAWTALAAGQGLGGTMVASDETGAIWTISPAYNPWTYRWEPATDEVQRIDAEGLDWGWGGLAASEGNVYTGTEGGDIVSIARATLLGPQVLQSSDIHVDASPGLLFDGAAPSAIFFAAASGELIAVGATATTDGTVVSRAPGAGSAWRTLSGNLPPTDAPHFFSAHGEAADDLWASTGTAVVHFDGASWTRDSAGPALAFASSIYVEGPGHVWVVDQGAALLYERRP